MASHALVGRCGIYCGACGAHRAYKDKGAKYLQKLTKAFQFPVEGIRCEGCHTLTPDCAGSQCKVVRCLNSKGFEYCYECTEYKNQSCAKFEDVAKKCAKYDMDLKANLYRIKIGETEAWLKECEEKYQCPKCGKSLPILGYKRKRCYHCGYDLSM